LSRYFSTAKELQKRLVALYKYHILQQHCSNAAADNPCEYYQRNVAIQLLDHIISFLDQQFCDSSITAVMLLGPMPSVLYTKNVDLKEAVARYRVDLPSPELFEAELTRWKRRFISKKKKKQQKNAIISWGGNKEMR